MEIAPHTYVTHLSKRKNDFELILNFVCFCYRAANAAQLELQFYVLQVKILQKKQKKHGGQTNVAFFFSFSAGSKLF